MSGSSVRRASIFAGLLLTAGPSTATELPTPISVPATRGEAALRMPSSIAVPAALRERTIGIEPSGIVWAPALDRYLVVSDDTGLPDARHAPWVLAMSREGVFDEKPVRVHGIKALNDGESICAGPDGTFFLTTSHSPNRKGNTREARRMLMLLELEHRHLNVIGRVDLTDARGPNGAPLSEIIGVDPGARLDIEAITFRDGALLVGLKSPLSARHGAIVLRLQGAAAALRAGRIPDGALARLWEVRLHVPAGQERAAKVAQGIADMTFLPDGSLVLVSNAPKGMPTDGGGSLFWYKPGAPDAVLVHRFLGLKPEGVTLADDGSSLVLVFDNDQRPPLWMRWPLQRPVPS